MSNAKRIYENLLHHGFSKQEIDSALHKFTLLRLKNKSHQQDITPTENHPNPHVRFFKKMNIRKHISGKALSLLQSQFAKKPKNPV